MHEATLAAGASPGLRANPWVWVQPLALVLALANPVSAHNPSLSPTAISVRHPSPLTWPPVPCGGLKPAAVGHRGERGARAPTDLLKTRAAAPCPPPQPLPAPLAAPAPAAALALGLLPRILKQPGPLCLATTFGGSQELLSGAEPPAGPGSMAPWGCCQLGAATRDQPCTPPGTNSPSTQLWPMCRTSLDLGTQGAPHGGDRSTQEQGQGSQPTCPQQCWLYKPQPSSRPRTQMGQEVAMGHFIAVQGLAGTEWGQGVPCPAGPTARRGTLRCRKKVVVTPSLPDPSCPHHPAPGPLLPH